jgi:uncharacterized delta-60 repeat protein
MLLAAQVYTTDFDFGAAGHANVPADQLIAPLPDGQILTVGTRYVPPDPNDDTGDDPGSFETVFSRLNADGTPDRAFGENGSHDFFDQVDAVAYLAGRLYFAVPGDYPENISRYTADGKLDTSFSGDGRVPVPYSGDAGMYNSVSIRSIIPTPDGKLIVSTYFSGDHAEGFTYQLTRINADGGLDKTFGTHGFITMPHGLIDPAAVPLRDGLLVLTQTSGASPVNVVRYDVDGKTVDTSFGDHGQLMLPVLTVIREQADGKLLVLPITDEFRSPTTTVTRLNANGSTDTSFADHGEFVLQNQAPASLSIDAQQRIVLATTRTVMRLNSRGVPDAFPFNGARIPRFDGGSGTMIAFDAAGRLLASISGLTRFDFVPQVVLANDQRLYVTGSPDSDHLAITSPKRDQIKVSLNGVVTRFDAQDIDGFNVDVGDGNNSVVLPLNRPLTLAAGAGADSLVTGDGNDSVNAGDGADTILTGEGNDDIDAHLGDNVINCGNGKDTVTTQDDPTSGTARNVIAGGDGDKYIEYAGGGGTMITLGVGNSTISAARSYSSSTHPTGDDVITIAGGNNDVTISGGHDVVRIGGDGRNDVTPEAGTFDIVTGAGEDEFVFGGGSSGTIDAGGGDDRISDYVGHGPYVFRGGDGDDRIRLEVLAAATVYGGAGNDRIQAADGAQVLSGGSGKDTINGGPGVDTISGNGGADELYGEGGRDRISGGAGDDLIDGGAANDVLSGQGGNDTIRGGTGNDQLSGGGGNDQLDGGAGTDRVTAGRGDDEIRAADGAADTIFGGAGRDRAQVDRLLDVVAEVES